MYVIESQRRALNSGQFVERQFQIDEFLNRISTHSHSTGSPGGGSTAVWPHTLRADRFRLTHGSTGLWSSGVGGREYLFLP